MKKKALWVYALAIGFAFLYASFAEAQCRNCPTNNGVRVQAPGVRVQVGPQYVPQPQYVQPQPQYIQPPTIQAVPVQPAQRIGYLVPTRRGFFGRWRGYTFVPAR